MKKIIPFIFLSCSTLPLALQAQVPTTSVYQKAPKLPDNVQITVRPVTKSGMHVVNKQSQISKISLTQPLYFYGFNKKDLQDMTAKTKSAVTKYKIVYFDWGYQPANESYEQGTVSGNSITFAKAIKQKKLTSGDKLFMDNIIISYKNSYYRAGSIKYMIID